MYLLGQTTTRRINRGESWSRPRDPEVRRRVRGSGVTPALVTEEKALSDPEPHSVVGRVLRRPTPS